jgi:glycosyltransferase involved in cell wall biosynthesis
MSRSQAGATTALAAHIDLRGARRRSALRQRITTVISTLDAAPVPQDVPSSALLNRLAATLGEPSEAGLWLALAVISARLPDRFAVQRAMRSARLDGPLAALSRTITATRPGWPVIRAEWRTVRVLTGEVIVDLHHTAKTDLATGIQRVARQSAQRWHREHGVTLVGWTRDMRALRELSRAEQHRALHGGSAIGPGASGQREIVVPWQCTYVLPELLTESYRARCVQAMLCYTGTRGAMIGFDCVPITSAETIGEGMGAGFSMMLSAIAHGDRIATISASAAAEYRGWRAMLCGAGVAGPDIEAVSLPVEAVHTSPAALEAAGELLTVGTVPAVLCVGSHEPRKNHLALLHAAELLWREGLSFSLVFVGGNAWNGERFDTRLAELQGIGRPVKSVRALSDDLLWAAYRLARCVVFPSLNEGFGLPVAESLACGTPVITSGFGSMREIAAAGGALLVDPRDDHDLRNALRRLLTDDALHAALSETARHRSVRTWDRYAAETWDYLVNACVPAGGSTVAGAGAR